MTGRETETRQQEGKEQKIATKQVKRIEKIIVRYKEKTIKGDNEIDRREE